MVFPSGAAGPSPTLTGRKVYPAPVSIALAQHRAFYFVNARPRESVFALRA